MPRPSPWTPLVLCLFVAAPTRAAEPLHTRIDALIAAKAGKSPISAQADDAEFLRRVYLDLAGRIPSAAEARAFLADKAPDKRTKLIDQLLAGPEYSQRMGEWFQQMFMERLGDNADWKKYLQASFAANKPFDQMTREVLRADSRDAATKGASFFMSKRLENYGQNPVDYPALTRDIGRLFLGVDLRCAQCHDHLFIDDYKQRDFQGLYAFVQNTYLPGKSSTVGEKAMTKKVAFMSVFKKVEHETGPRLPGGKEMPIPTFDKGKEYVGPPNPKAGDPGEVKFSPLSELAKELPQAENPLFVRNAANRLWFTLMGRGLVHPLDLHHKGNPPSHPELLALLAEEFAQHKFDMKYLLREIALSGTYQRSSVLPSGQKKSDPTLFLTALEKRVSAEQLLSSVLEATGERTSAKPPAIEAARVKFLKAFANPRREPEDEINPSLQAALFVLNDATVLSWLTPQSGNLIDRLDKITDADKVAEELYLTVLTRLPSAEEKIEVADYLKKHADRRGVALGHLAWALLASTEFCVNH